MIIAGAGARLVFTPVVNLNLKGVSPFTLPLILPYISVGVQDNKRASNCTFDFSWVEILRSTNKHTLHRTLQRYVKKTQTRNLSLTKHKKS